MSIHHPTPHPIRRLSRPHKNWRYYEDLIFPPAEDEEKQDRDWLLSHGYKASQEDEE